MIGPDSNESQTALSVVVNGKQVHASVPDRLLLSDFLRDHLGLTALKVACGEGACGACTIVIDGEPARSCTLLAVQTEGSEIVTLEGMNAPQGLNHVQQLFQQHHALQCGYCTPGWLMTVYTMIERSIRSGLRRGRPISQRAPLPLHRISKYLDGCSACAGAAKGRERGE